MGPDEETPMNFIALSLAGVSATLFAIPALAHHSFAMFDHNITTSMTGTVKELEWINPHAWVHMTVMGANGEPQTWSFEAGSVRQLADAGWQRDDVNVGDTIEMIFHPLKDGSFGGQVRTVVTPSGKRFCLYMECLEADGGAP